MTDNQFALNPIQETGIIKSDSQPAVDAPFVLTPSQEAGLFKISFSNDNIIICGPAGTGKTTLLRKLIDTFPNSRIVYCAPTHAAKEVIEETLNTTAHTIHAVLRIKADTYEDEIQFKQGDIPDLSEVDILVVDESSMLDGQLFSIMLATVPSSCRIIGLGDPYQLQPPKNEAGILSPIFFHEAFTRVILTEIVRQGKDSPIIKVATDIRKNAMIPYHCVDDEGGVCKHTSLNMFFQEYWKYVKVPEDTLRYKMIAYKNVTVDKMNALIRQRLYNTEEDFVPGEYLIMQQPVYRSLKAKGVQIDELVFHNGETVRIVDSPDSIQLIQEKIALEKYTGMDPIEIEYYRLNLTNKKGDQTYSINVLLDDSHKGELEMYLNYAAMHYKRMSRTGTSKWTMKDLWSKWWATKNKFHEVKGAAVCTVHKSQGCSLDGVFYIRDGIDNEDYVHPKIRRQLDYVAVTRARKFVHFISS